LGGLVAHAWLGHLPAPYRGRHRHPPSHLRPHPAPGLAGAWHHHSFPGAHPRPDRAVPIGRAAAARGGGHSHPFRRGLVPADARLGGTRHAPRGERALSADLARAVTFRAPAMGATRGRESLGGPSSVICQGARPRASVCSGATTPYTLPFSPR